MLLSEILKSRRAALGYTLLEIANKMGVSEATVQRWESGVIKSIKYDKIEKLASVLDVDPAALMGWEDEKPPEPDGDQDFLLLLSKMSTEEKEQLKDYALYVISRHNQ